MLPTGSCRSNRNRARGVADRLADAPSMVSERRQVVNLPQVPATVITEYQLLSKTCICCGTVSTADWPAPTT